MNIMNKRRNALCIALLFAVVAALIFQYSDTVVWMGDDCTYQYDFASSPNWNERTPLENVSDIIPSQMVHYMTTNGRFVAHVIVQYFVGFAGQLPFSAINALMWLLFIFIVIKLTGGPFRFSTVLLITLLVLFGFDTSYTPACQIGFVWMGVLAFGWCCLYVRAEKRELKGYHLALLFLFGILAGNSQEAYTIPISGALIVRHVFERKRITARQWAMFFGFGLGTLLICISPGSLSRASEMQTSLIGSAMRLLITIRLLYLFLAVLLVRRITCGLDLKRFYRENGFWIHIILFSLAFNLFIGVYTLRQLLGAEIAALILTVKLLKDRPNKVPLLLLSVFISFVYVSRWQVIVQERDICRRIAAEYLASDDGTIYLDLEPVTRPLFSNAVCYDLKYRDDYAFYRYAKVLQDRLQIDKPLLICPPILREVERRTDKNCMLHLSDGGYLLVQDRRHPASFTAIRQFNVLGITRPKQSYHIEFSHDFPLNTEDFRIDFFYDEVPFIDLLDIEMTE